MELDGAPMLSDALMEIESEHKVHPLISDLDFRRATITPWAAEDAEPHGCTWPVRLCPQTLVLCRHFNPHSQPPSAPIVPRDHTQSL